MNDIEWSNKLNNAPIESIEIDDIIGFCEIRREEGIDLDYKSNWPSDLEKVICSFANTQGGIILIGVHEEEKTRKPKTPIDGIDGEQPTIYQRIMNIASDGIYPPISPEVRICELPNQKGKYVVLIRILPSRLMHSTDRRRRIYIRVADNSRGYDLASVSDLEWLWERKTLLEEKRKEIYLSAISHSGSNAIPWNSVEDEQHWNTIPKLHISIIPSFPSPEKTVESDQLLKVVQSLPQVRSNWNDVDRTVPESIGYWRTIPGGVCSSNRGYNKFLQYLEFGQLAHVHATIGIETFTAIDGNPVHDEFTWAYIILAYIDITLKFAHEFFSAVEYTWPITVNVILELTNLIRINYSVPGRQNPFRSDFMSSFAPDKELQLLNTEITPPQLLGEGTLMSTTAHNLFWSFGLGWEKSKVSGWLDATVSKRT
jgi:hypothetical protein